MSERVYTAADFSTPQQVMARMAHIAAEQANLQNAWESAASNVYDIRREARRAEARAMITSTAKSVTEKKAEAELAGLEADEDGVEPIHSVFKFKAGLLNSQAILLAGLLKGHGQG